MKRLISLTYLICAASLAALAGNVVTDSLGTARGTAQSILDLVEGEVAGVNSCSVDGSINTTTNIYIRGLNAIHSDSQPLIILDGVILSSYLGQNLDAFYNDPQTCYLSPVNNLGFMSMHNIESIEVVKDLSATALYGSEAANGVIVIRTKRPQTEGRTIEWHSNLLTDIPTISNSAFSSSISHNHSVSVSHLNKRNSLNITGFFRDRNGIVKGTGNMTGGLAIRLDIKSNPIVWFSFSSNNSAGSQSSTTGPAYPGLASMMMASRYPDLFPSDKVERWAVDYDDKVSDKRSVNNAKLTINLAKSLALNFNLGADFDSNQRGIWYGNGTSFGLAHNGAASVLESTLFNYNASADLSFTRYFNTKHRLAARLFVGTDGNANKFNAMSGYNFFVHSLRAKGLSIMQSDVQLHKFQRSYNEKNGGTVLSYDFDGIVGAEASLSFGFTGKYDDSPVLYPAVSVYADLHKAFFNDCTAISALRIEAGYGAAGREYYIPYELTDTYYTGTYPEVHPGAETFYDSLNRLYSTEYNAGIGIGFLDGGINLGVKYYDKRTVDRYSMFCFGAHSDEANLWAYTTRQDSFSNSDTIRNCGFEINADATILNTGGFTWKIRGTAAFNENQIIESNGENVRGRGLGAGTFVNVNAKGCSVSALYGYKEDASGNYRDYFKDGVIDEMDKVIIADALPKLIYSFGTSFRKDAFSLDLLFRGNMGSHIANIGKLIADGKSELSDSYVESGSFLRLAHLSLSYDIPVDSRFVKGLKLSLSGNNLFTATEYSGWNPDVNCFGSSALSYGVDYGGYPVFRTISLGIGMNF